MPSRQDDDLKFSSKLVKELEAKVEQLELQVEAGRKLAERALECSSELPHSVKELAFAFFGKPCGGMCCAQKRKGETPHVHRFESIGRGESACSCGQMG